MSDIRPAGDGIGDAPSGTRRRASTRFADRAADAPDAAATYALQPPPGNANAA